MSDTIITLNDLLGSVEAIQSKENADRALLQSFLDMTDVEIRNKLLTWAGAGFPDNFVFYSIQLNTLEKCSDGIARSDIITYIQYLNPQLSLVDVLKSLETRLPGMTLSYSYTLGFLLEIHVSKQ